MLSCARRAWSLGRVARASTVAAAAVASCALLTPTAAHAEPASAQRISTDAPSENSHLPPSLPSLATILQDHCAVFDGRTLRKVPGGLWEIAREALQQGYDCLCVGEVHDDPVAHAVELSLLAELIAQTEAPGGRRPLSLSLEFFERDVQAVMDEYLLGLCREQDLLKDGRAWNNYHADYRPMVELCRAHRLPVVCANAPRRHVSLAGRTGAGSLGQLPEASRTHLPPLPYEGPSELYADKFAWTMRSMQPQLEAEKTETAAKGGRECPYIGLSSASSNMLDAQCLWDASMAHSIHNELLRLRAHPTTSGTPEGSGSEPLVLHVCGKFHCENHLGIPERLERMPLRRSGEAAGAHEGETASATRTLVVCVVPSARKHILKEELPEAARGMADYVVLGDAELRRSFEVQHPV